LDSGGSCANAIATLGRLGAQAIYCGHVGDDEMGHLYAGLMTEACGSHALRFTSQAPTGKCLSIISAKDAERTMVTDLGAAIRLPELGDFGQIIDKSRVVHFTGYTLLDDPMRQVVLEAMERASQMGAKISIDAADPFVILLIKDLLWDLLERYADIFFLNAEEAQKLTDEPEEKAIFTIAERAGVDTVVVKLGAKGSLILHQGQLHRIAVHPVKAVDTTGAGDTYAGGYLYGVISGWDVPRSGRLASIVAAMTVGQIGAVVKNDDMLKEAISMAQNDR
ncbi:MAG: adenosine kinase, partial [Proteobacteria bacterium]|nr:adenosine kinase [Pseudomonadota bacterium]